MRLENSFGRILYIKIIEQKVLYYTDRILLLSIAFFDIVSIEFHASQAVAFS